MLVAQQTKMMLKYNDHSQILASNLASNLRQSAFADVKIVCCDGSVWAHRLILAAVSPFLEKLLLTNFDQGERLV